MVRIHVGIGQRCHAIPDVDSPAGLPWWPQTHRVFQRGKEGQVRKGSRCKAHLSSAIIMDIAVFKVSHSVLHKDATALRARRTRPSSIGAMRELLPKVRTLQALTHCNAKIMSTRATEGQFKGQFKGGDGEIVAEGSKCKDPPAANTRITSAQQSVSSRPVQGDNRSAQGPVQGGSAHILRCQNHEHTHSNQSVQGGNA